MNHLTYESAASSSWQDRPRLSCCISFSCPESFMILMIIITIIKDLIMLIIFLGLMLIVFLSLWWWCNWKWERPLLFASFCISMLAFCFLNNPPWHWGFSVSLFNCFQVSVVTHLEIAVSLSRHQLINYIPKHKARTLSSSSSSSLTVFLP